MRPVSHIIIALLRYRQPPHMFIVVFYHDINNELHLITSDSQRCNILYQTPHTALDVRMSHTEVEIQTDFPISYHDYTILCVRPL